MNTNANKTEHADPFHGKRIVILQIIPELDSGGAERGCVDVAKAIMAAGGDAIVVSEGGRLVGELKKSGAKYIRLPVKSKNPGVMIANIGRLAEIIRAHKVDIVHARSRAPAWSAYYACRRTGARFVTTFHAAYKFNGPIKRRYNSIMTKGQRIIAISHFIAGHIAKNYGIPESRIRIVPRGIDLNKFHQSRVIPHQIEKLVEIWRVPDDKPVILLPGRLTRVKGHRTFIEALALRGKKDVRAIIVGSDQGRTGYRAELQELINKKNLQDTVHLTDHCDNMPAAYMLASVAVAPSIIEEGFGRIPVEAQAMGRPVIASALGGHNETIINCETGLLVKPNDPKALAIAINSSLLLTTREREVLAEKAIRNVAENYTVEVMCAKTLDVYGELLSALPTARERAFLSHKKAA
ncbi:MAG: glycosyltransferase family 4 protein [Pseudomonadota bacterium]|nr:glycosyltransferase family 4 protein [Pseudomonadota bacterium]